MRNIKSIIYSCKDNKSDSFSKRSSNGSVFYSPCPSDDCIEGLEEHMGYDNKAYYERVFIRTCLTETESNETFLEECCPKCETADKRDPESIVTGGDIEGVHVDVKKVIFVSKDEYIELRKKMILSPLEDSRYNQVYTVSTINKSDEYNNLFTQDCEYEIYLKMYEFANFIVKRCINDKVELYDDNVFSEVFNIVTESTDLFSKLFREHLKDLLDNGVATINFVEIINNKTTTSTIDKLVGTLLDFKIKENKPNSVDSDGDKTFESIISDEERAAFRRTAATFVIDVIFDLLKCYNRTYVNEM